MGWSDCERIAIASIWFHPFTFESIEPLWTNFECCGLIKYQIQFADSFIGRMILFQIGMDIIISSKTSTCVIAPWPKFSAITIWDGMRVSKLTMMNSSLIELFWVIGCHTEPTSHEVVCWVFLKLYCTFFFGRFFVCILSRTPRLQLKCFCARGEDYKCKWY